MDLAKILTRGKGDQFAASEKIAPSVDDSSTSETTATFTHEQVEAALAETEARTATAYEVATALGGDSKLAQVFLSADLSVESIKALGAEIASVMEAQLEAGKAAEGGEEQQENGEQARRADFRTKAASASVDVPDSPSPEEKDADADAYLKEMKAILQEKGKLNHE